MSEQEKRREVERSKPSKQSKPTKSSQGYRGSKNTDGQSRPPFPPDSGDQPPSNKNKNLIFILIAVAVGFYLLTVYSNENIQQIDRTQFLGWMEDKEIEIHELRIQRTMDAYEVTGKRLLDVSELDKQTQGNSFFGGGASTEKYSQFRTHLIDLNHELINQWQNSKNIKITVIHETTHWFESILSFLPFLLLIGLFWFMMMRQSGGGPGGRGIFSFGKSRAKMQDPNRPKVNFKDVAGCDEAKGELEEVVHFLKDPSKYAKLGGKIPKGALLLGPPGTGKTLLAKAVAGEAEVPFFSMSGSDFVEMFVGVGASRVRDLFENGKKHAPCIIFIDEIDAVGRQRGTGVGGGHDEREQTLNQLLVEMDGFEGNEGIILIAATNRADVLDKALLRPGRFDRQVVVDTPDAKGRAEILQVHLRKRKVPISDDVDAEIIAKGTPGMSGADIENLVNEAALMAARYNADKVSMIDFEEAKDKLMIGPERRSRVMTQDELRTTAYHEAGHALITHLMEHSDTLHKLTIIPRGMALGITFSLPEKDRYTMDKRYLEDQIAILLGGRAAEILIFNQKNTGASNDIERATDIARRMVTEWGMTDELGPIVYAKKKQDPFLGRDMGETSNFSETTAVKIDEVVRSIIEEQMERVNSLLEEHKETLITLSEALLEHEVLDREEILDVLDGKTLESSKKTRQYEAMLKAQEEAQEEAAKVKDIAQQVEGLGAKVDEIIDESLSHPQPIPTEVKTSESNPSSEASADATFEEAMPSQESPSSPQSASSQETTPVEMTPAEAAPRDEDLKEDSKDKLDA